MLHDFFFTHEAQDWLLKIRDQRFQAVKMQYMYFQIFDLITGFFTFFTTFEICPDNSCHHGDCPSPFEKPHQVSLLANQFHELLDGSWCLSSDLS